MRKTAYLLAYFDVVEGVFKPVQWILSTAEYQTQDLRLHSVVMAHGYGNDFGEGLANMKMGLEAYPGTNKSSKYLLERLKELMKDWEANNMTGQVVTTPG